MPTVILAQVVLAHANGIAADSVVNDFVFLDTAASDLDTTAMDIIKAALTNFYNGTFASIKLSDFLSGSLSRGANKNQIRYYDVTDTLTGGRHGSPKRTDNWTLAGTSGTNGLPAELAIAVSFRADYGNQSEFGPGIGPKGGPLRPRARRRGRLYIGPMTTSSLSVEGTTFRVYPAVNVRNCLLGAVKSLMDLANPTLAVWSRVDGNALPAIEAWSDDAFDTQRRRGEKPVSRLTVTAA